jgi:hypothetical protein
VTCHHLKGRGFSGVICFSEGFEGELAKRRWGDPEAVWGAIVNKGIRGSDAWEMNATALGLARETQGVGAD